MRIKILDTDCVRFLSDDGVPLFHIQCDRDSVAPAIEVRGVESIQDHTGSLLVVPEVSNKVIIRHRKWGE